MKIFKIELILQISHHQSLSGLLLGQFPMHNVMNYPKQIKNAKINDDPSLIND